MTVQVLVATINQNDHSLLERMNIQTDAIVGNQCGRNEVEDFEYNNHSIKWISTDERGVGLNRNNTLFRATSDIVLFADDDVVYHDGYEKIVSDYYEAHPEADMVLFNFLIRRKNEEFRHRVTKTQRVRKKSATKYGTYCISARREKLRFANICFHLDFGGGTKYSCGEDTIFLQECIEKGLKIYSTTTLIGVVDHGESTWFNSYNDKLFYDKGILFYFISKRFCRFYALYHCLKHRKKYSEYGWKKAYGHMLKGISYAKKMR